MIPLFAPERPTTSPHAGDSIDSTCVTRSPHETNDRASPEWPCRHFSFRRALFNTQETISTVGVPDELLVKEAVHMSSFQHKVCLKCGRCPVAGNQLRRCGSCLAVKHCSYACQTEDWASHRLVCKNVGAARKEELMALLLAAQDGDVATVSLTHGQQSMLRS